MRQFTIAAAAVATFALVSAAPALAEHLGGGPTKQNGQCWKKHQGAAAGPASDNRWGTWGACEAAPAAAPATPTATRRRT
jgi:hypothetical protein